MSDEAPGAAAGAAALFAAAWCAGQQAQRAAGGPVAHTVRVAGASLRLEFAGPALVARLLPALAHLLGATAVPPALTVSLWDSASTGVAMPPPPWSWGEDCTGRGEVRGYNRGAFRTAYQVGSGVLSLMDCAGRRAVYWVRDARQVPFYETACPLRSILSWWGHASGTGEVVHGAAVGTAAGGVLIAGQGGAGKSTTCLACLQDGFRFAGDNNVLLQLGPAPTAHSLYNSATIEAETLARLPHLRALVRNAGALETEKALLFVTDQGAERVCASLPLRAVLLPRVTGRPGTQARPAPPAQALAALAPGTVFSLPHTGPEAFRFMAQLVRALPCFLLEAGTDLRAIPRTIAALIAES